MQQTSVKPETIVKRRMQDAMEKFCTTHGRAMQLKEEHSDERPSLGYRVKLESFTRFSYGQARYEGREGTWLCWMNEEASKIVGTPKKKDDNVPVFGIKQYEIVGSRSDEELYDMLASGRKELVFQSGSGLTLIIKRRSNAEVQYEIVWRDRDEKRIHTTHYIGFNAFEQIREKEALQLCNFWIVDAYEYSE